jgi:pyruvate/2-oxoglutarate dehydrogenase complex dihydrolipoamide acyltransferase (E2) component
MVPVVRNAEKFNIQSNWSWYQKTGVKHVTDKLLLTTWLEEHFTITNGVFFGSILSTPVLIRHSGNFGIHNHWERPIAVNG